MDLLRKHILLALKSAKRGYKVNTIQRMLPACAANSQFLVLMALHKMYAEGRVRRTPNSCLWLLTE